MEKTDILNSYKESASALAKISEDSKKVLRSIQNSGDVVLHNFLQKHERSTRECLTDIYQIIGYLTITK
jgi:hypothetical protein